MPLDDALDATYFFYFGLAEFILDELKYLREFLIFPGLVVIFVNIEELLLPPIFVIEFFRMVMGYKFILFRSHEQPWDFDAFNGM